MRIFRRTVVTLLAACLLSALLFAGWFWWTPSGTKYRYLLADSLLTTQHREYAMLLIGKRGLEARLAAYTEQFEQMGEERDTAVIALPGADGAGVKESASVLQRTSYGGQGGAGSGADGAPLVTVEEVEGDGYQGYLLTVADPQAIRLVVPKTRGQGERVSDMVLRTGAAAGVNAGGFEDPGWQGNGFKPDGLVIADGQIYYNDLINPTTVRIVGLDGNGRMIAGNYTLNELQAMGVKEAVSFGPRIIVNGHGLIKNREEGWGIAPRTVMGQREDGAILFLVIDGRQIGYSLGVTLFEAQEVMLEHGAVIAANLDGGSSSVLVNAAGELVNRPSAASGERRLPTAFLVFEHPEAIHVPNVWAGLSPAEIQPYTLD